MKLAASLIATTFASHYRGGSYQVVDQGADLKIITTHNWRYNSGGFSPKCTQADVGTTGNRLVIASAKGLNSGSSLGSYNLAMNLLFAHDDFCYGDGESIMSKPNEPFTFGWDSCCWTSFTGDNGAKHYSGSMVQKLTVNEVNNNSPTFKLPANAMVMSGCQGMKSDVSAFDADGDAFKCRWATTTEGGGAANQGRYPSLTLDENTCVVTYNGQNDATSNGVKAVALMLEDFDAQGNVKSSVPVQYLIRVWTPNMARSNRFRGYPDVFGGDEGDDHEESNASTAPVRGRRSTPAYCSAQPEYIAPTPAQGDNLTAAQGAISFVLAASSPNGAISSFEYTPPAGLTCSAVQNDAVTCSWQMTQAQMSGSHSFCYEAVDAAGLKAPQQCLTIDSSNVIDSISVMANEILDGSGAGGFTFNDAVNYGCAGRGTFDAWSVNAGHVIDGDSVDAAFNAWKHCVRCAAGTKKAVEAYVYDKDQDSCAASSSSSRGVCECDKALVNTLKDASPTNNNYNTGSCTPNGGGNGNLECCTFKTHFYAHYNSATHCCNSSEGVKEAGSC